jgi:hypothetical protein
VLTAEAYGPHQPTHKATDSLAVTVDRTAPTVTKMSPAPGTRLVPRGANIAVRFGEAVAPASLNRSTVVLRKAAAGGTAVRLTLSFATATNTLTANPGGAGALRLAPNTVYRVSLSSDVKDVAGNPLRATRWTLRTR